MDRRWIYGNLLSLPVGEGFLYVEPLYVSGAGSSNQPLLRRVIVYYGSKIGYGQDLAGALKNLTQLVVGQDINDTTPGSDDDADDHSQHGDSDDEQCADVDADHHIGAVDGFGPDRRGAQGTGCCGSAPDRGLQERGSGGDRCGPGRSQEVFG